MSRRIGIPGRADGRVIIPSSSGIATYESAFASPPSSPNAGDLWFITDSLLGARYNGSAWQYYWGTQQVTKPVLADFSTWVNQGSATATDYGQIVLYAPATTGDNVRGKIKNAPSLNYTIDMLFIPGIVQTNYNNCGFCWSDGTKLVTFSAGSVSGGHGLDVTKWNSATSWNGTYATVSIIPFAVYSMPLWLRITEDASNRTCYYSFDYGKNFHQVHQVGRTDFLTATKVGFFLYVNNGTYDPTMTILSWKES